MNECINEEKDLIEKVFQNDSSAYKRWQDIKFEQGLKILGRYNNEWNSNPEIVSRIEKRISSFLQKSSC